ncbi:MIP/aquaporin family protein [Mucilaginibacter sp.]
MRTPSQSLLRLGVAEFVGTALLLAGGLSMVIILWGDGSPVPQWIPGLAARRLLNGFLFGSIGCLVSLSPVGKISGAHINPSVSFAFWLNGKMKTHAMLAYIGSQLLGALTGSLPLLMWGHLGQSVRYGSTIPGPAGLWAAVLGESLATACLILLIFSFAGSKRLRNYTPFAIPVLVSIMVWAETVYSGCSTNLARSFGPAVISGVFTGFWVYLIAPFTGTALMVGVFRWLKLHRKHPIEAARVSYHDHHSPESIKTSD